jgi:hypothetical protein
MNRKLLVISLTALSFGFGCAETPQEAPASQLGQQNDPRNNGVDPGPVPDPDRPVERQLVYDGAATIDVAFGGRGTVSVWYADMSGGSVVDGEVTFQVQGGGLQLEARTARTDSDGVATVGVYGGNDPGSFKVIASAKYTQPLPFTINVIPESNASYLVQPVYAGGARLDTMQVALIDARYTCAGLDPLNLPAIVQAEELELDGGVIREIGFEGLDNGSKYTVVAVAHMSPSVLTAFGCNDSRPVIVEGVPQRIELDVVEAIPGLVGSYDIESRFDVTDGLPEQHRDNINFVGNLFADPVRAFVDVLFGDPNDDNDGFTGRFIDDSPHWRSLVTAVLRDAIAATDFGQDLNAFFQPGGDAYRVLTNFTLRGDLNIVSEPNIEDRLEGNNLHVYRTLVTQWDGQAYEYDLASFHGVGVLTSTFQGGIVRGNDGMYLEIDRHGFPFNYGAVALGLFERLLLPRVFGVNSFEGAIESMVGGCGNFASEMFPGFTEYFQRRLAEVACDEAVEYMANEVREKLAGDGAGIPNVTLATFPLDYNNVEPCKLGEPNHYGQGDTLRRVAAMGHDDARCIWDARFESDGVDSAVDASFLSSRQ